MSEKEVRKAGILARVKADDFTQVEAAEMLGLSYRQTKRLYRRYFELGADGLVHGNAGKRSNHSKAAKVRQRVSDLVTKHYGGASVSASVRRWQRSIWPKITDWRWMRKRCGGGCWKRICGHASGSANRTGKDG